LDDGLFLDVNETWVQLNGYTREEVIGSYARTMHIWPDPESAVKFIEELKAKGTLRGWEQAFYKKSDEVYEAQPSAQVLTLSEQRERQRLAMVLHDGLQQLLVAAKFKAALLERESDLHNAAIGLSNLIDDSIETSRSLTACRRKSQSCCFTLCANCYSI
jgi:PAS domain S-box-containing protein